MRALQARLDPARADDPPTTLQAFACGLAAGMLAKLGTHPLDVAKKRFQVAGLQRSTRYGQVGGVGGVGGQAGPETLLSARCVGVGAGGASGSALCKVHHHQQAAEGLQASVVYPILPAEMRAYALLPKHVPLGRAARNPAGKV